MTLQQLKETVRTLIGKAKIKEAIDEIARWAHEQDQEQLKDDIAQLRGTMLNLNREKNLGLLSSSDATTQLNQLRNKVLSLMTDLEDIEAGIITQNDKPPIAITQPLTASGKLQILMLTANPAGTTKVNLDKEYTSIGEKLQSKPDQFNLTVKKAVSKSEFMQFIDTSKPDILHFSGHGESGKYGGIIVQNDDKNGEDMITPKGLDALFEYFKEEGINLKAVVLNACYSEEQAQVIAKYVPYVIGTTVEIGDTLAIAFSVGFYYKLAEEKGLDFEKAFRSGRTRAVLDGADKSNFTLYKNGKNHDL